MFTLDQKVTDNAVKTKKRPWEKKKKENWIVKKKNTNNYDNGNEDDRYSNNYNTNFLVMQYCSLLSKL